MTPKQQADFDRRAAKFKSLTPEGKRRHIETAAMKRRTRLANAYADAMGQPRPTVRVPRPSEPRAPLPEAKRARKNYSDPVYLAQEPKTPGCLTVAQKQQLFG